MENAKPEINVTPLIDVLLVLLIIFMVIAPLKPTDFKTKLPRPPAQSGTPDPHVLIVSLNTDAKIELNNESDLGTIEEPQKLVERLSEIFRQRAENHVYAADLEFRNDLNEEEKIQKTVFIKAPRKTEYGRVVKLIDAIKIAGASPISLQIDDLN
jgi:biopolymer transport protein ExbD